MRTTTHRRSGGLAALVAAAAIGLAACSGGPSSASVTSGASSTSGGGATSTTPSDANGAGTPLDPSLFARGSCVVLPPSHGNRHETVFLDAGHGGVDPGAVGRTKSGHTVYEKNLTLPVELDTAALLRAEGYRVVVSRTNGGPVAIPRPGAIVGGVYTAAGTHAEGVARNVCANRAKAKVLVGIYFDAGSSPLNAGCVTGYDSVRSFAAANLRFARLLQHDVLTAMNKHGWKIPDAGVLSDTGLGSAASAAAVAYGHLLLLGPAKPGYLSAPTKMPGALIEPLFITDPFEASIADSSLGQHVMARGIARAVEEFLR